MGWDGARWKSTWDEAGVGLIVWGGVVGCSRVDDVEVR